MTKSTSTIRGSSLTRLLNFEEVVKLSPNPLLSDAYPCVRSVILSHSHHLLLCEQTNRERIEYCILILNWLFLSVFLTLYHKVTPRLFAGGTFFWRLSAIVDISTLHTHPPDIFIFLEECSSFHFL